MSATPDHSGILRAAGILNDRLASLCPVLLVALPPVAANWQEFRGLADMLAWPAFVALLSCLWWCMGRITLLWSEEEERKLREQWGCRPGVRMLRHGDPGISAKIKQLLHGRLKGHGCGSMPSPEAERLGPKQADDAYSFALAHCDHRFRDRLEFRALWQKRMVYEFMLGCLALRWLGLASCIVTLLLSCARPPRMSIATNPDAQFTLLLAFDRISPEVLAVSLIMTSGWMFLFTPNTVHKAAHSLDFHILECLVEMHPIKDRRNSRSTTAP